MKGVLRFIVVGVAALAAFPAYAIAGNLTLHPSGFGEKSYAAWKAHQGLADTKGNDDQALYFQKLTATETVAAGVAVIKGIAGLTTSQLTGLEFWRRKDGWCGAGAPRWNITVKPDAGGDQQTFFIGCAAMAKGEEKTAPNGQIFERRTFPGTGAFGCCVEGPNGPEVFTGFSQLPAGTITSLAIVFDEGTTQFGLPLGPGKVHLDNILVETSSASTPTHCWTGANDNSNQSDSGACTDPPNAAGTSTLVGGTSLAVPAGLAVDPTDTELVTALNLAYAGVPLTSWSLYPTVLY